jgi:hypothetical protein
VVGHELSRHAQQECLTAMSHPWQPTGPLPEVVAPVAPLCVAQAAGPSASDPQFALPIAGEASAEATSSPLLPRTTCRRTV